MTNLKKQLSPEDIFTQAVSEERHSLTEGDMRLLVSGLAALREYRENRVNAQELKAINGMIAYIAYTQKTREETVTEIVTSIFNVPHVQALPSKKYDEVIEYLVDLQMDKVLN